MQPTDKYIYENVVPSKNKNFTTNLRFNRLSLDCDIDIDNVFVREVNGNAGVMTNMDTDDFEGDAP